MLKKVRLEPACWDLPSPPIRYLFFFFWPRVGFAVPLEGGSPKPHPHPHNWALLREHQHGHNPPSHVSSRYIPSVGRYIPTYVDGRRGIRQTGAYYNLSTIGCLLLHPSPWAHASSTSPQHRNTGTDWIGTWYVPVLSVAHGTQTPSAIGSQPGGSAALPWPLSDMRPSSTLPLKNPGYQARIFRPVSLSILATSAHRILHRPSHAVLHL